MKNKFQNKINELQSFTPRLKESFASRLIRSESFVLRRRSLWSLGSGQSKDGNSRESYEIEEFFQQALYLTSLPAGFLMFPS